MTFATFNFDGVVDWEVGKLIIVWRKGFKFLDCKPLAMQSNLSWKLVFGIDFSLLHGFILCNEEETLFGCNLATSWAFV